MKRLLALALALVMVLTLIPVSNVSAQTSDRVTDLVANMSLRDKVTQMMMVDFRKWGETADAATDFRVMNDEVHDILTAYKFGAVMLYANNIMDTEQTYSLTLAMQQAATADGGLPMLIATDQEGGNVYRLGSGTALPGNMALGATYTAHGTTYARAAGDIIGAELSVLGINTNMGPVVDVNNNPNNPVLGLRSYSSDGTIVGEMASATIAGMASYNVIGCAAHFPGHGDTATDSHYGLPIVDKSLDVLKDVELKPYEVAIDQGIEMIMTTHILYPQLEGDKIVSNKTGEEESLPATMSDDILTDLLKGEMGFDGIVITDAMYESAITQKWDSVQAITIAINAGADMVSFPCQLYCADDLANLEAIVSGVVAAAESGEIPMERINDACTRILTVKENRGILDWSEENCDLDKALETVGCDEHRAMEREMSAAAVTVVRNDGSLPLNITETSKILMLCPYNNERAQMIIGWNRAKEAGLIPEGAEVDYCRFNSATILDELQAKLDWADTYIIVTEVSSTARMEYKHWLSAMPNQFCDYAATNGKTAVIASCDKPYDVQMYPNANAVLAAYGCKGSSVDPAEALENGLTGSVAACGPNIIAAVEVALGTFGATGTLPVAIHKYDLEANAYTDEVIYDRGYGLTYEDRLPEAVENPFTDVPEGSFYANPVLWAVENGITTGATADTFNPDGKCLRAQVVTFLWRAAKNPEPESTDNPFTDVKEADFFYKPVLWAVENKITNGTSATTFGSYANCNRAAVVTFLWRAAGSPEPESTDNPFTDVKETDFFYKPVLWAVENGITNGVSATEFGPTKDCNRAQVVTFLYRAYTGNT